MYALLLILFLNVTEQAKKPTEVKKPVPQSPYLLPLIMIKTKGVFQPPTHIEKPDISKDKPAGLGIGTKFKRNYDEGEVVFFCPAKDKYAKRIKYQNEKRHESYFNPNCLFKKTFRKSILGSFKELKCDKPATPIVIKNESEDGTEKVHVGCGPGTVGKFYEFVYELCIPMSKKEKDRFNFKSMLKRHKELPCAGFEYFKLYKFCFNHTEKTTIFTEHEVIEPTLFAQAEMMYDREKKFGMMTESYELFEDFFEQQASAYKEQQQFAQKLVPSDHLFFGLWKKATYHFANTKPQNEDLSSLWTEITDLILHNSTSMISHKHLIYTGAFKFPNENGNYNTDNPTKPLRLYMPDIWVCAVIQMPKVKTSTTDYKGIVFIMSNYIRNVEAKQIVKNYCKKSSCQESLIRKFIAKGGYIRCCPVTLTILQFFGFSDFGIREVLYIHDLNNEADINLNDYDFENPIDGRETEN